MVDWKEHIRETAAHLLLMAKTPGWQEHAQFRRDALIANRMYGQALREELDRQQAKPKKERK
jgi:hypothetical protein